MSFQLVYLPKSGNKNYWTVNNYFTHKDNQHFYWDQLEQLYDEFSHLKKKFPTLFANKRDDRFYIYTDDGQEVSQLVAQLADTEKAAAPIPQSAATPKQSSLLAVPPKGCYAIAARVGGTMYYYSSKTGANGAMIGPQAGEIRFWKKSDLAKAMATVRALSVNAKFLHRLPGLQPAMLTVINARTGAAVWPINNLDQPTTPEQAEEDVATNAALLAEVKQQLSDHFNPDKQESIQNDQGFRFNPPEVDLERYDARKVFDALCYLIAALDQRPAVNELLSVYDKLILQDYLHTAELVGSHIDGDAFVASLHQMRQQRRKIKDLSILLDTIDENIDQALILKGLLGHQSLHSQYHFRNRELGERLLTMINPSLEDTQIPEND